MLRYELSVGISIIFGILTVVNKDSNELLSIIFMLISFTSLVYGIVNIALENMIRDSKKIQIRTE